MNLTCDFATHAKRTAFESWGRSDMGGWGLDGVCESFEVDPQYLKRMHGVVCCQSLSDFPLMVFVETPRHDTTVNKAVKHHPSKLLEGFLLEIGMLDPCICTMLLL